MPRFKKIKSIVNKKVIEAWINVDSKGTFSISVPTYIAEALDIDDSISGKDAEKIEYKYLKLVRDYDKLVVKSTYRIKYRIMLSDRIRSQMPVSIMTDEAWKQTARIGSEYISDKALSVLIDWFPIEIRVKGKEEVVTRLRVPDEDDWAMNKAQKQLEAGEDAEFYLYYIHKPFEGLILVHDERHWEWNDANKVYRDIPLTQETFDFFSSVEQSFVSMLTKLFGFLHKDEKLLMKDISKALQQSYFKLLTNE